MHDIVPIPPHVASFCRLNSMLSHIAPLSPYGRDRVAEIGLVTDAGILESLYDDIEAAGAFLAKLDEVRRDRLFWHFGKLPRIPQLNVAAPCGLMELFLFKKFLLHYRNICDLVSEEFRDHFGIVFESSDLLEALSAGSRDAESFAISEGHEPGLGPIRARIAEADQTVAQRRQTLEAACQEAYGFDFAGREFIVISVDRALAAIEKGRRGEAPSLAAEPYDAHSMIVRIIPDAVLLGAEEDRRRAREEERLLEQTAIARLSGLVAASGGALARYCSAVKRFDYALAQWKFVRQYRLVRPALLKNAAGDVHATGADRSDRAPAGNAASLSCRGARFMPLEEECVSRGVPYEPLDFTLDRPVGILSGSNMGGKTCVLQTLVFLQVLAQCGMFVPASHFETPVFQWLDVVGEAGETAGRGLSAYGFEIRRLIDVLKAARDAPGLAVFDEFARTTSAGEAEALMQAIVEHLASFSGTLCIFATHIQCSPAQGKGRAFRMAGFDAGQARATLNSGKAKGEETLEALLARINSLMRYRVVPRDESGEVSDSDALAVARLLGLDATLVDRAEELLNLGARRDAHDKRRMARSNEEH
ncbi:MAG: hypothetical protein ABFC85_02915 [Rectinema sp.]